MTLEAITDAVVGVIGEEAGTVMTVTGNTIVGPDDDMGRLIAGVEFREGSSGSATNNAISNYFVDDPGVGCGIRVQEGTGVVATENNTFPPPGNEENVCMFAWMDGRRRMGWQTCFYRVDAGIAHVFTRSVPAWGCDCQPQTFAAD